MALQSNTNPDAYCHKLLAKGSREARDWLNEGKENTLGVLQTQPESLQFIHEVYELGAPHVFAVEIDNDHGMENTGTIVVELSLEPERRSGVFEWAARIAEEQGFDAYRDVGQKYLFVMLD